MIDLETIDKVYLYPGSTDLRKGNSIICKCQQKLDIIGKIYGDVKVIRKTEKHSFFIR